MLMATPDLDAAIAEARNRGYVSLDELTGKQILARYGLTIPRSVRVDAIDHLEQALQDIKPPFVLKVISPTLIHKSEAGGVRLGLPDEAAVSVAIREMTERARRDGHRIDGFLVEDTAPAGHDVVVGGVRDPSFGPIIMFGLGGAFVEVLRDVAFRICPISREDAREMIREIRGHPILAGARGGIAVPESLLIDVLLVIGGEGGLLLDLTDKIAEVDINPLIVSAAGAVAVDARFILAGEHEHGA